MVTVLWLLFPAHIWRPEQPASAGGASSLWRSGHGLGRLPTLFRSDSTYIMLLIRINCNSAIMNCLKDLKYVE